MKKHYFLKTVLLLCMAMVGATSAWAETVTFTPGTDMDATSVTKGVVTATMTTMNNESYYQIYANNSGTFSCSGGKITKIEFTCTASGTTKYGPGNASANVGTYSYSGTNGTWTGEAESVTISTTVQIRMTTLSITYSSTDSRTPVNITGFSADKTTIIKGGTTSTSVTNDQNGWTASYTYTSSNEEIATVDADGVVTAVSKGSARITVTLDVDNDDEDYRAGSTTSKYIDITVSNPSHTAYFSVNGFVKNIYNDVVEEGEDISLPTGLTDICEKRFLGWVTSPLVGTTDDEPSFVSSVKMGTSDVTFYAVFASVTGETEPCWAETDLADMTASDVFVFANGSYAVSNDKGTSGAPIPVSITVADDKITSAVADNIKWQVTGNGTDGYTFYRNGTTNYLYCNTTAKSSSNDNMRVGTGDRKLWVFTDGGILVTKDNYTSRYLSMYSTQDFRSYTGTANGAFVPKFYKYIAASATYSDYCTTIPAPTATISSSLYATYVAPTDVDFEGTGVTAYTAKYGTNKVDLTEVTEVPMGTAVILKAAAADTYTLKFAESPAEVENNELLISDGTTAKGENVFVLADKSNGVGFYLWTSDTSLSEGKVYMVLPEAAARQFVSFDNDATGILSIDNEQATNSAVYNLQGQKMLDGKSLKGLYIVNGKKMIGK